MADESKYPTRIPPYGLRMPPELKERVEASAKANSRSLHAEIIHALEEKYPPEDDFERLLKMLHQAKRMQLAAKTEHERKVFEKVLQRVSNELGVAAFGEVSASERNRIAHGQKPEPDDS